MKAFVKVIGTPLVNPRIQGNPSTWKKITSPITNISNARNGSKAILPSLNPCITYRGYATMKDFTQTIRYSTVTPAQQQQQQSYDSQIWEFTTDGDYAKLPPMTKTEFLQHIPSSLPLRDLRNVWESSITPFKGANTPRQISSILVRDNCLIVKLEHLKAIIFSNGLLLFDADEPVVEEFAYSLRRALKTRPTNEPFEFRVLDTMLSAVTQEFENRLYLLSPVVDKVLNLTDDKDALMRIVPMKKSLTNFQYSVKEFQSALEDVLKSDEDLSNLYLSYKTETSTPRPILDHVEAEFMLEVYSKKAEEIENEIAQLNENIRALEHLIEISLDSVRNQLMRMNMGVAIVTLGFSAGSFAASLFGMNLLNGLETHPFAFQYVGTGIAASASMLCLGLGIYYFKHTRRGRNGRLMNVNSFFDNINSVQYVHQIYGKANKDDLKKILKGAVGRRLTEAEINQIFEGFDRNKDGNWDKRDFPYHYEEMPGPWTSVAEDESKLSNKS